MRHCKNPSLETGRSCSSATCRFPSFFIIYTWKYYTCSISQHETSVPRVLYNLCSTVVRGGQSHGMDFHGNDGNESAPTGTSAVRSCVAPPRPITLSATRVTPRAQCRRSRQWRDRFVASVPRKVDTLYLRSKLTVLSTLFSLLSWELLSHRVVLFAQNVTRCHVPSFVAHTGELGERREREKGKE